MSRGAPGGPIPVNVLTGFLGAGKTTLLRHLLSSLEFAACAVLVNEFGEIGLDHHLIADVRGDVVLMQSGCICCTMRGDFATAIRDLYARLERGEITFNRVVIETTGLADPTPILATIMHERQIRHHFRLSSVLVAVDAVNGTEQLLRQPESVKQVALADSIVITKVDLTNADGLADLETRLAQLNPAARQWRSANTPPPPEWVLADATELPLRLPTAIVPPERDRQDHGSDDHAHDVNRHDARIHAFTLSLEEGVDWNVFAIWFTLLLTSHGADILRVKGLLRVVDAAGPIVINAVQQLVHPPVHLQAWPEDWQQSRLVFIVRDLQADDLAQSLKTFHAMLRQVSDPVIQQAAG